MGHFLHVCKSKPKSITKPINSDKAVSTCNLGSSLSKEGLKIQGVAVDFLVDSSSDSNIINLETWEYMKADGIVSAIKKPDIGLYPYTVSKPFDVYRCLNAEIEAENQKVTAEVNVMNDRGHPLLLGLHTSTASGILKIGIKVGPGIVN